MTTNGYQPYDELAGQLSIGQALDHEVATHSELFYHVSMQRAYAVDQRDTAKVELGELKARLQQGVRQSLADAGVRATEAMVQAEIDTTTEYQDKVRQYLALCAEAERWDVLRSAYQQRSYMLRALVDLAVSGNAAFSVGGTKGEELAAEAGRQALKSVRKAVSDRVERHRLGVT